jgi:hypothetical protein
MELVAVGTLDSAASAPGAGPPSLGTVVLPQAGRTEHVVANAAKTKWRLIWILRFVV